MKFIRIILLIFSVFMFVGLASGCVTKKRVLVIECPTSKPAELNKEGFKNEIKREKSLDKKNKNRQKENK